MAGRLVPFAVMGSEIGDGWAAAGDVAMDAGVGSWICESRLGGGALVRRTVMVTRVPGSPFISLPTALTLKLAFRAAKMGISVPRNGMVSSHAAHLCRPQT